jgi:transposase-like protein
MSWSLVTEMYARGLSTRDVEDAFRDATGDLLISRSAVTSITDRLWEEYQAFSTRCNRCRRPSIDTALVDRLAFKATRAME